MAVTAAQVRQAFSDLLRHEPLPEQIAAAIAGYDTDEQMRAGIQNSAEYRNLHDIPHPHTWRGQPLSEAQGRERTRALYRKYADQSAFPKTEINDEAHADRMADEVFPTLWKNAAGRAQYSGAFDDALSDHETTAWERAGRPSAAR